MKKLLSIILALAMLLSMGTMASAAYGEHEHQLMDMANMACHYSECTICFELFNVGDHTFKDGKCTVCGHYEPVNPFVDVKKMRGITMRLLKLFIQVLSMVNQQQNLSLMTFLLMRKQSSLRLV